MVLDKLFRNEVLVEQRLRGHQIKGALQWLEQVFAPPLTPPVLKHTSSYTLTTAYPVQAVRQASHLVAKIPPAGASHEIAVAVSAEIAVAVASPAESGIIHIHQTPI